MVQFFTFVYPALQMELLRLNRSIERTTTQIQVLGNDAMLIGGCFPGYRTRMLRPFYGSKLISKRRQIFTKRHRRRVPKDFDLRRHRRESTKLHITLPQSSIVIITTSSTR
jgi:hypothetical protein